MVSKKGHVAIGSVFTFNRGGLFTIQRASRESGKNQDRESLLNGIRKKSKGGSLSHTGLVRLCLVVSSLTRKFTCAGFWMS